MTWPNYVLTHAADADLRQIIRHTRKEWGDAQVRRYVTKLEQGMACLATGQGHFKDMSALYPALRMVRCERHYVFGLITRACTRVDRGRLTRTHGLDGSACRPVIEIRVSECTA